MLSAVETRDDILTECESYNGSENKSTEIKKTRTSFHTPKHLGRDDILHKTCPEEKVGAYHYIFASKDVVPC